jgi:putative oxidoreductase
MFDAFSRYTLVPLLLRLGLGVVFIYHGIDLVSKEGGTGWNDKLSVPVQALVAWAQLVGGIALAVGFLTRLAALGIAIIMIGAIATVHWEHGFSIQNHGYEYNSVLIVVCVAVILLGPGNLAVDRVFRLRRRTAAPV